MTKSLSLGKVITGCLFFKAQLSNLSTLAQSAYMQKVLPIIICATVYSSWKISIDIAGSSVQNAAEC